MLDIKLINCDWRLTKSEQINLCEGYMGYFNIVSMYLVHDSITKTLNKSPLSYHTADRHVRPCEVRSAHVQATELEHTVST